MLMWFPTCLVLLILTKTKLQKNHCQLVSQNHKYLVFRIQYFTVLSFKFQKRIFKPFFSNCKFKILNIYFSRKLVFLIKIIGPQKVSAIRAPGLAKVPPCHSADFHQSVFSRKIKTTRLLRKSSRRGFQLRGMDFWIIPSRTFEIYLRVSTFLTEARRGARGFIGILDDQG